MVALAQLVLLLCLIYFLNSYESITIANIVSDRRGNYKVQARSSWLLGVSATFLLLLSTTVTISNLIA